MVDSSNTTIKVKKLTDLERARIAEAELVRLREFVQFVADHSNDIGIVTEARKHGAE